MSRKRKGGNKIILCCRLCGGAGTRPLYIIGDDTWVNVVCAECKGTGEYVDRDKKKIAKY